MAGLEAITLPSLFLQPVDQQDVPRQAPAGGHRQPPSPCRCRCQPVSCYSHRVKPSRSPHRLTRPRARDWHKHGCVSLCATVLLCHLGTSHRGPRHRHCHPLPPRVPGMQAQQGWAAGSPQSSGSRMDSNIPVVLGGAGGRQGRVRHRFRHQPGPWVRR